MRRFVVSVLAFVMSLYGSVGWVGADPGKHIVTVKIPVGTKVYCELDQLVVSKKRFAEGDKVRAHVLRDPVVVDGNVVIPRGAPVDTRIWKLKTNKIAGVKGKLELYRGCQCNRRGASSPFLAATGRWAPTTPPWRSPSAPSSPGR